MRFKKAKYLLLLIIPALLFLNFALSQDYGSKNELLTEMIFQGFDKAHYKPQKVDDSLSMNVFGEFLKRLDYGKRFLLKSDLEKLKQFEYKIDDQIQIGSTEFFDFSFDIIEERLDVVNGYYQEILDKPFNFDINENLDIDPENREFASNEEELRELWRKMLKYEVINKLLELNEEQDKLLENKDTVITAKTFKELETEAREKVSKRYKNLFNRLDQYEKDDRFADYMNSMAKVFDPHSQYMPPMDKEDFEINISGSLEGIGALLSQRDEYIKVERIIPGSPSWKQGELKAGDIILKVAQAGEDAVDVVDMRLDKAVRLIRGPKGSEVRLTVKKIDGSITLVPIIRDVVYREETFAKSVILKDKKSDDKIGYIKLPSFYVDFRDRNARRSSTDMKKEIEKLKNESVDGIILDLRNNSGGSLQDAVEIAGLFLDGGPIVQVHSPYQATQVLRDRSKEIDYNGNLIVMVNSFSASASEILSAAMQDYERALIVGTKSTYGKGTVQKVFNLDDRLNYTFEQFKPLGALKLTIQKFYRINGGSTQLKGVIPDIVLPDIYNYTDIGEKELDYALPWDELDPASYRKFDFVRDFLPGILSASNNRVGKDSSFILINQNGKRLEELREETVYSLNYKKFKERRSTLKEEAKKYENIGKNILGVEVISIDSDLSKIESDSTKMAIREDWISNLKKDLYLYETVHIMEDMIKLRSN